MAQVVMIVLDILSHRVPPLVFWPLLPIRGDGSIGARYSPVSAEDPKSMPLHIQVYRQASRNSRWPFYIGQSVWVSCVPIFVCDGRG
jgi:hypothetical protein